MAKILEMPKLSPTMEEGRIATWHKKEGEEVAIDDLLAEVETDKATMEFRSFDKGTLLKILSPAGSTVVLGQPVAILGAKGEDVGALVAQAGGAKSAEKQAESAPAAKGNGGAASSGATTATAVASAATKTTPSVAPAAVEASIDASGRIKASPYVRKVAREQGFDLRSVRGSGPHGRIVARDLEGAGRGATPSARPTTTTSIARVPVAPGELSAPEAKPLSMMRKTIARRLTESKQTVPHFYLTVDLDADALVELREHINADLAALVPQGEKPEKVSLNDLVIKACALGLRLVPQCNASFTPEALLIHTRVDISVAVAIDDGLVTPVVRDADRKSVREISAEVRELAVRAKSKKLKPEEMTNGTFSISNLGMFGVDAFAAVINPPEGAILAVGQVRKEAVIKGDSVVVGHRLACTLSCDHRVVDGAVGAAFLRELRKIVEHPTAILV
jgi:pyruvate dehydrogenase E2 component (dihydrolipoamide acetyltransferase)